MYVRTDFMTLFSFCTGGKIRTHDPRFWRPMLYQLSYTRKPGFFIDKENRSINSGSPRQFMLDINLRFQLPDQHLRYGHLRESRISNRFP